LQSALFDGMPPQRIEDAMIGAAQIDRQDQDTSEEEDNERKAQSGCHIIVAAEQL
jgi:hypothetical protein